MGSPYLPAAASDLPVTVENLRCDNCHKLLAELVTSPYRFRCPRCRTINHHP